MKRAYKRWVVLLLWGFLAGWVAPAASRADDAVAVAVQRGKQAGVPEQALNHILTLGYEYDLQPDEVARFLDLSREARRSDLPLDPLIGKMDEGLAKRVRVRTVARAVEKEMNRYRFVRQLARKAMDRNSIQSRHLRGRDLARMAKAASMGLQDSELEAFFSEAPPASMAQYAHALELTAAMKQSGLDFAKGKEIAFDRRRGNCLACHAIPGGVSPGNIGPPLIVMNKRFPSKEKLREQIWDPGQANRNTMMPPFGRHMILTEDEIDKVVEFVWTL